MMQVAIMWWGLGIKEKWRGHLLGACRGYGSG